MTGEWLIGGNMKVNRVLTDDEVRAINEAAGVSDLPRREGFADGGGLYANIHAKRERIAQGSGERMRKPGSEGAPTESAFEAAAKKAEGGLMQAFAGGGHATPAWQRSEGKNPEGGLNAAGRASYNNETGGNLQPPVSSEAAKSSPKKAKRRKSFCARMEGNPGPMKDENGKPTRKALALRKWDC
jgi:hypothetical protein